MAELRQDFTLWRGEDRTFSFIVADAAGLTSPWWYMAAEPASAAANRDLTLQVGSGITLQDSGADCIVTCTITKTQSAGLFLGLRYHELWGTDASGQDKLFASGVVTVRPSLRG